MTRFYFERRPLLILVSGCGCTGKSTLAIKLANRLNLPSVIHSDVILRVVEASGSADEMLSQDEDERSRVGARQQSFNKTSEEQDPELRDYIRRCRLARLALDHDIRRCLVGGKALIIEGKHIDPSMFTDIQRGERAREDDDIKKDGEKRILKASTSAASAASILAATAARENAVICVFVLSIDEPGHLLLLRGQQLRLGGSFCDGSKVVAQRQKELRVQKYLTSSNQHANVLSVNVGDPTKTLNELHRRVLDRVLGQG